MKLKRVTKILGILIILGITTVSFLLVSFFHITNGARLESAKLACISGDYSDTNFLVLDQSEKVIDVSDSEDVLKIESLNKHTTDAFICMEDKRFFKHKGVDFIRIGGALVQNLKSGKIEAGGSTISQQLIKNTHLTSDRTMARKLKEIRLALNLERKYTKTQILEMYLNNIYFGNNSYGLEQASKNYFNKQAKDLNLAESALLAGIISAPSIYNPISDMKSAVKRKEIVLTVMFNQKVITKDEYTAALKENIVVSNLNETEYTCMNEILREASKVLGVSISKIKRSGYKIKTYIDEALQKRIEKEIQGESYNIKGGNGSSADIVSMVVDNETGGIIVCASKSKYNMSVVKRSPGSIIKPIVVYAPAVEKEKIVPVSFVLDDRLSINGYHPSNAAGEYHGWITVRQAVEQSLNIPAIKVLSYAGVDYSKQVAESMGLSFNKKDDSLVVALGGLTDGVLIKEVAESYTTLANTGVHKNISIIKSIQDSGGNVIYSHDTKPYRSIKESSAYIITDMLKGVSKTGTAKKLKGLRYEVASKTGTVSAPNSPKNTDAWNCAYTTKHTVISWIGNTADAASNMDSSINGATYPTLLTKNVLDKVYSVNKKPGRFEMPESVIVKNLNTEQLALQKIQFEENPGSNTTTELFTAKAIEKLNLN